MFSVACKSIDRNRPVLEGLTPPAAEQTPPAAGAPGELRLRQHHVSPGRRRLVCDRLLHERGLGLQQGLLRIGSLVLCFSFDAQESSQVQVQPSGAPTRQRGILSALWTGNPELGYRDRVGYRLTAHALEQFIRCYFVNSFSLLALSCRLRAEIFSGLE